MKKILLSLLLIVLATSLLACASQQSNDVQEPGQQEPLICTKEYNPVCGVDGETYSNPCMAGDTQIAYEGTCDSRHICTEKEKQAEICTMEYAPVCGSDNTTYGNGCGACAAGVEYWIQGEC